METLFRLLLGLVFLFASAGSAVAQDLVAQGIEAMGGERALGELRTIAIRGQDIQWEYESSYEPGPQAKQRQSGEAKFMIQRDLVGGNARIDWDRRVVRTTPPLNFKYSEIMTGGIGYVSGIDSASRTETSMKSNPPGHPMSGGRTAATLRELDAPVTAPNARHKEQRQVGENHRGAERRREAIAGGTIRCAQLELRRDVRSRHTASGAHSHA